jgi:hypothetical protein
VHDLRAYLSFGALPTVLMLAWVVTIAIRRALPPSGCYLALAFAPLVTLVLWLVVPNNPHAATGRVLTGVQFALFMNTMTGAVTAAALGVLGATCLIVGAAVRAPARAKHLTTAANDEGRRSARRDHEWA